MISSAHQSEQVDNADAHQRSHTLVAVDGVGRKLAERMGGL
jgi:Holliday junction resolvasome RuvABC DNA-binding subunit